MTKMHGSMTLLLALSSAFVMAPADADAPPPNFILVLVDDLGWADLGCYGSTYYETPHIDRLAAEGMRFSQAYAAAAVCSPTRAAVMTGRHPARVGITDWIRARFQGGEIPEDKQAPTEYVRTENAPLECPPNALWLEHDEVTIARLLQKAGYTTAHIGKWHLGADAWYPENHGFDYNIGGCDFGQPPSYFDPYTSKNMGDIPTLAPRKAGEYLTDREADEAARFIRTYQDRPFFLHLAHYTVHTPIQAKEELIDYYKKKAPTDEQKDPVYAAMVHSLDDAMGVILAALEECGLDDNTLIFFTSDNGGLLGPTHNGPLRSGKGYPYEGGIRVPFIVRWPGQVAAGAVNDTPVISMDLFPTLAAVAKVQKPANRAIDGVDLVPLLRGEAMGDRDTLFWHFPHYRQGYDGVTPYSIIRQGDWKLIKRYEGPQYELFDLAADVGEENDLAAAHPDKVVALDKALTRELDQVDAKLPRPIP